MSRRVFRIDSVPPEGIHDQPTAVGDASVILAAVRRAQTARDTSDITATTKASPFDLADALARAGQDGPERHESGTRLTAVRPPETSYATAPADAVEVIPLAAIDLAEPAPPPSAPSGAREPGEVVQRRRKLVLRAGVAVLIVASIVAVSLLR